MQDNEHGEIWRCIIGALMVQLQPAIIADMFDLDISVKNWAFAAFRATPQEAIAKCLAYRSFFFYVVHNVPTLILAWILALSGCDKNYEKAFATLCRMGQTLKRYLAYVFSGPSSCLWAWFSFFSCAASPVLMADLCVATGDSWSGIGLPFLQLQQSCCR